MKIPEGFRIISRITAAWLSLVLRRPPPLPLNVTLSLTNKCFSRCRTCNIWKIYRDSPELAEQELHGEEWGMILENIGTSARWVTISGGNQFLRNDLVSIIVRLIDSCRPRLINFPVSGFDPQPVIEKAESIIENCEKNKVDLIFNLSLDGEEDIHDSIRGVQGDFRNTLKTYNYLKKLQKRYKNFHLGIYSVVSSLNVTDIPKVCDFVMEKLKPDSYSIEIAEHREELRNMDESIIPDWEAYQKAVNYYLKKSRDLDQGLLKLKRVLRERYYAAMEQKGKATCFAGTASVQISPYGEVWPCCTRAEVLGNLRESGYDLRKIWHSRRAEEFRQTLRKNGCRCTHSNPFYTNLLMRPWELLRVGAGYLIK